MNAQLPYVRAGDKIKASQFNALADAVRRATPVQGFGTNVSQSAAGSVIGTQPVRIGQFGAEVVYPFQLSFERVEGGHDYCIYRCLDKSVFVEEVAAVSRSNDSITGSAWKRLSDDFTKSGLVSTVTDAEIDDLRVGERIDVYAVCAKMSDGFRYYLLLPSEIYTSSAPSDIEIPTGFDADAVTKVFVGTIARTGTDASTDKAIYAVLNQSVKSAISVSPKTEETHPFKIRVVGEHIEVYLPYGCVQTSDHGGVNGTILVETGLVQPYQGEKWYRVADVPDGDSRRNVPLYVHVNWSDYSGHYTVNSTNVPFGTVNSGALIGYVYLLRSGVYEIGQYLRNTLVFDDTSRQAGGGGTSVTVDDRRTDTRNPGIVGLVSAGATGVSFVAKDGIGPDVVFFDPSDATKTLLTYLDGTDDYSDVAGSTLGTNLNTDNYPDLILEHDLERTNEMDLVGTSDYASRADHKHMAWEILGEGSVTGELVSVFSNVDGFTGLLSGLGMWDDISLATGDDTILALSDVNLDESSVLEADSENGSVGSASAGLALSDHSHPINVGSGSPSDVEYGGSASAGSATTYARSDHVHAMPSLDASDIVFGSSDVGTVLTDHETRILSLEDGGGGGGTVTSVDNVQPVNGNVPLDALTKSNYASTLGSVYQAKSDSLGKLVSELNSDGTIPSSQIVDFSCNKRCLAICDNGEFGHSDSGLSNSATFGGDWPTLQQMSNCFTVSGSGLSNELKVLVSRLKGSSSDTNRVVTTDGKGNVSLNSAGNGLEVSSGVLRAKVKSGGGLTADENGLSISQLTADKWMKTDGSGNLSTTNDSPVSVDSTKTGLLLNTAGTLSYVTPKSGTTNVTVVTGLNWNGTQLVASKSNLTFVNGVLTNVKNAASDTIGTVTYNP